MGGTIDRDTRYFVGLIPGHSQSPAQILASPRRPVLSTAVTFEPPDPDRAGKLLLLASRHADYGDAVAAAVHSGFAYRSANLGEYQIAAALRPGDLWACLVYTRQRPLILAGGYSDARMSYADFAAAGRITDPATTPLDLVFHQAEIDRLAGMF